MRVACGALLLGLMLFVQTGLAQRAADKNLNLPEDPSTVGGKTLKEWRDELTSKDASRRAVAILAVGQFPNGAAKLVPDLIARLDDGDVSPRAKALLVLRIIAIEEKAVPEVVRAVSRRLLPSHESQAVIRMEATATLARFIPDCGPVVPNIIIGTMDKSSWEIRHNCIALLWRTGVETARDSVNDRVSDVRITEALLTCLRNSKTFQEKLETIQGLGAMGRPSDSSLRARVINELTLCTNTRTKENRPLTIWAFVGLIAMDDGPSDASLKSLAKFLKSQDLEIRVQAAAALGALKTKAKKCIPDLLAMLRDKEPIAVGAACSALGAIGDTSDTVVDPLMELLAHKDPAFVAIAVSSLVQLKQNTTRVLSAFDKMRETKDLPLGLRALIEEATKELKKPVKR